eukprot:6928980-Prymnesium_polylepis.1
MSREPALEVGECPLTRHRPQVRRATHTHGWPMVRHKAVLERYADLRCLRHGVGVVERSNRYIIGSRPVPAT